MVSHFTFFSLFLLVNLYSIHVYADIVFEEGYTVTTVLDGNKLGINPHSILPQYGSSDLIILDSSGSAFYAVSFSKSQESVIKRLSGDGAPGYADGELGSAEFKNPRSFALDLKGNVYVADRFNHAIRKISKSGVTTIAGGYSQKPGHADGPAQNASFSDDFELAFIPERCALMISDHGNRLVRQINMKIEDCARGSQSGVLGMTSAWVLGLGVACLFGLIVGFVIRPYVAPHEGSRPLCISKTWKLCLISLGKRVQISCLDIRSAIVSSTHYALLRKFTMLGLSHLSLMFGLNLVEPRTVREKKSVSLLDSDKLSCSEITKSQILANQLKDLISLDGGLELSDTSQIYNNEERTDFLFDSHGRIDSMIYANITGFAEQAKRTSMGESLESSSGLVKRK